MWESPRLATDLIRLSWMRRLAASHELWQMSSRMLATHAPRSSAACPDIAQGRCMPTVLSLRSAAWSDASLQAERDSASISAIGGALQLDANDETSAMPVLSQLHQLQQRGVHVRRESALVPWRMMCHAWGLACLSASAQLSDWIMLATKLGSSFKAYGLLE